MNNNNNTPTFVASGRLLLLSVVVCTFTVVSLISYYGVSNTVLADVNTSEMSKLRQRIDTHNNSIISSSSNSSVFSSSTASPEGPKSNSHALEVNVEERVPQPSSETPAPSFSTMEKEHENDPNEIHMVFSMSCAQLHRQTLQTVLQHSAMAVGQRGPITQILSGCSDEEKAAILQEPTFYDDFRRHFTPAYSPHPEPNITDDYLPYNKPFALRHFLLLADPPITQKIIALIDGDFVFFKKLEVNTGRSVAKFYHGTRDPSTVNDTVANGTAIAQDWVNYMQAGWFADSQRGNLEKVCEDNAACLNVSEADGREFYSGTGPPYIVTTHDLIRMVDDYCRFVVKGRQVTQAWMTEMYAYAVAAGTHTIKHTLLTNLGITHPKYAAKAHEYWDFVDEELPNPCEDPFEVVMPLDPPVGLHYCQIYGYVLEEDKGYHYYKYSLPRDLHECNSPLLKLPPAAVEWRFLAAIEDKAKRQQKRHEVWVECSMIKLVNQAILLLKQRTCPEGFNTFRGTEIKKS